MFQLDSCLPFSLSRASISDFRFFVVSPWMSQLAPSTPFLVQVAAVKPPFWLAFLPGLRFHHIKRGVPKKGERMVFYQTPLGPPTPDFFQDFLPLFSFWKFDQYIFNTNYTLGPIDKLLLLVSPSKSHFGQELPKRPEPEHTPHQFLKLDMIRIVLPALWKTNVLVLTTRVWRFGFETSRFWNFSIF